MGPELELSGHQGTLKGLAAVLVDRTYPRLVKKQMIGPHIPEHLSMANKMGRKIVLLTRPNNTCRSVLGCQGLISSGERNKKTELNTMYSYSCLSVGGIFVSFKRCPPVRGQVRIPIPPMKSESWGPE